MKKSMVKFWGVRGSIPTPGPNTVFYGGNTACVELRINDHIIILDAGTGIRELGKSLVTEFGGKPMQLNLLITHAHWDHIQGFPFFVPAYDSRNNITIHGYDNTGLGLKSAFSQQMEVPYFPVQLDKMSANLQIHTLTELDFGINQISVKAHFLNHPGVCVAYRVFSGKRSVAYLPDVELPYRSRRKRTEIPQSVLDEEEKLVQFLEGTDILIMDSQYNASEYEAHAGWGHTCVEDSVALAIRANVRHLYLFHHDPDHTDEQISQLVARARQIAEQTGSLLLIDAAREGVELDLEHC